MSSRRTATKAERDGELRPPGRAGIDRVVRLLRRRIALHQILPGSRLREWDIAAEFSIPRLAAREALDGLVHQGFAEREPNRGVMVRRRTLAEVLQLFDLREVNEGLCARLAAQGVAPESWDDLIETFGTPMQQIVAQKDLTSYVRNYDRLRQRMMAAAGSPPLTELLRRLQDLTAVVSQRVLLVTNRTEQALEEHGMLLKALRRGDAAEAERVRRLTVRSVRVLIETYATFIL